MPGYQACDGGDASVDGRDFHGSMIGDRVVDWQGIEPSLVAFQPWVGGHRGFVVVEASLACPGIEASMATRAPMQATKEAIKFGDREYPCRSPRRSSPIRPVGRLDLPYVDP